MVQLERRSVNQKLFEKTGLNFSYRLAFSKDNLNFINQELVKGAFSRQQDAEQERSEPKACALLRFGYGVPHQR